MEGGKGRALEHIKMKQLIEEDELSETEIQQAMEQSRYYNTMKNKKIKDQIKSMEQRHKQLDDEMKDYLVDVNELKKAGTTV